MSYESMAREEMECDFPGCSKLFDVTDGARVACVKKDGTIVAFCKEHCQRLRKDGVNLRSLADIHAERKEAENRPIRERQALEQAARESAFINGLKS